MPRIADVTGTVAPDGTISLQGGMSWPAGVCQPGGEWRLTTWNTRYDARADSITGAFSFVTQKHLNSCNYLPALSVEVTRISLSRGPLAGPNFAGHWQGTVVATGCTTVGWSTCFPPNGGDVFEMNLLQDGTQIRGTLGAAFALTVTGSVDGNVLRLNAVHVAPESGGVRTLRVADWSTQRDTVGRLTGTYRLIDEFVWTAGPNSGSTWSLTYNMELRSVVRVPW